MSSSYITDLMPDYFYDTRYVINQAKVKPDSALKRLEAFDKLSIKSKDHAEKIKEASKEIFERYEKKMNSVCGKIRTLYYAILEKVFRCTNTRRANYQALKDLNERIQKLEFHSEDKVVIASRSSTKAKEKAIKEAKEKAAREKAAKEAEEKAAREKAIKEKEEVIPGDPILHSEFRGLNYKAFSLYQPDDPPAFSFPNNEVDTLLEEPIFNVGTLLDEALVKDLISFICSNGFEDLMGTPSGEASAAKLRYILYMSSKKSPLSYEHKEKIKKELVMAFQDFAPVQHQTVTKLYNELCPCKTLKAAFTLQWQIYKEKQFNEWISRHAKERTTHLVLLAGRIGLEGKEIAEKTRSRSYLNRTESEKLFSEFKSSLSIDDFIGFLVEKINNPIDTQIDKGLFTAKQTELKAPSINQAVLHLLCEYGILTPKKPVIPKSIHPSTRPHYEEMKAIKASYEEDIDQELKRLRRKGILTPEIEDKLDISIKNLGSYKANKAKVKVAISRALEIKKQFKDHYVFISAQYVNWIFTAYLIKELVRDRYAPDSIRAFKFLRPPKDEKERLETYTERYTKIKDYPIYFDHDPTVKKELISATLRFLDNPGGESALYYLSGNSSVTLSLQTINDEIITELLPHVSPKIKDKLNKEVKKYVSTYYANLGSLNVICIPEKLIESTDTNPQYRSHNYGIPCRCHTKHKEVLDALRDEKIVDESKKCPWRNHPTKQSPQFRILASRLRPEEDTSIYTITPIPKETRREFKEKIRKILKGEI